MPDRPLGIGDAAAVEYRLAREELPLPGNRKAVIAAFSQIIEKGGVQKIVIEHNRPIRVDRLVPRGALPDIPEAPEEDLYAMARNATILPFELPVETGPFLTLFLAFHYLTQKKLKPTQFLVLRMNDLRKWLELDVLPIDSLFDVPIAESAEVPSEVALLCATDEASGEMTTLRLSLETKGTSNEASD